jgi:type II secretory pathway pseudopilin PulG
MRARNAFTLTEVLMAMFCMAIGMISVLALFPAGLESMNQAIHANRVSVAVANAEAAADAFNLRGSTAFDAPSQPSAARTIGGRTVAVAGPTTGPSRALLVDPIGFRFVTNATRWVGDVERINFAFPGTNPEIQWCSLSDGIVLNQAGASAFNNPVSRERKYSWFYIWRRPRWDDGGIVDLTIVICSGRPITDSSANDGVRTATAAFTNGQTLVRLGSNLGLRSGDWIMDASATNGYFYKVASVNSGGTVIFLDTPARANGAVAAYIPTVVEVFEKNSTLFAK